MLPTQQSRAFWRRFAPGPRPGSPWTVVPLTGQQLNNGAESSVGECRLSLAFIGASHTWSHVLLRPDGGARVGNADQVQRYGRGSCVGWQRRGTTQCTALISDMPEPREHHH
jgi:hypothetical protein